MNKDLIDYIGNSLNNGVSESKIKSNLKEFGWSDNDIEKAFKRCNNGSFNNSQKYSKNKFMNLKAITFVVLGVLIIGGVATASYLILDDKVNITTHELINETINAMSDIDSASFDLLTKAYQENEFFELDLSFSGVSSFELSSFDFNKQHIYFEGGITMAESDQRLSLGLEYRVTDNTIYIKVNHLPIIIPQEVGGEFVGKWIKIEKDEIGSQIESYTGSLNQNHDDYSLTEDQKKIIKNVLIETNWFKEVSIKNNVEGKIKNSYLIEWEIDLEELENVISKINPIIMEIFDDEEFAQELFNDIDEVEDSASEYLRSIEKISGSAIIDKDSYLLNQISVYLVSDPTNVNFDLSLGNFNEPISIEIPEETQSINELLGIPQESSSLETKESNSVKFQANVLNSLKFIFPN